MLPAVTANIIALIGFLLFLYVAVGLLLRERARRRAEERGRMYGPHAPDSENDAAAMARSSLEGHAGSR